jgi:hypothetical protein
MSLTSYRAAPPRGDGGLAAMVVKRACGGFRAFFRFGGDLLSRVLGRSTIGAAALNGRVRDGIGCFARAHATKPAKRTGGFGPCGPGLSARTRLSFVVWSCHWFRVDDLWPGQGRPLARTGPPASGSDRAYRAISTGQLNALPRLHLRPIDVVVFHGPQGRPGFEGGFPLRCLQRLSCPHIATLHCRGRDNRSTSGASTPVLSY